MASFSSSDSEEESTRLLPLSGAQINTYSQDLIMPKSDYGSWNGHSLLQCPICFEDVKRENMRSLLNCGEHIVCAACMASHLQALISNVSTAPLLTCPAPRCQATAEVYELESLVDEATYQRYLQFTALDSLKKEAHTKWCINPNCAQPIIWDPAIPIVDCPACHTNFCFSCSKPPHPGLKCGESQPAIKPPSGKSNATQETIIEINDPSGANNDPEADYLAWKKSIGAKVKPCPNCKVDVEKNMGCQHMTCTNCSHQWCWLCLSTYTPTHFSDPNSLCSGLQFSNGDTLQEALTNSGRSQNQIELLLAEAPVREALLQQQRRRRLIRKIIIYTLLSPLIIVVVILTLPFLGAWVLL